MMPLGKGGGVTSFRGATCCHFVCASLQQKIFAAEKVRLPQRNLTAQGEKISAFCLPCASYMSFLL